MLLNKKGFLLLEAMIVSSVVSLTLIVIYVQFNTVYDNYQKRLSYENVEDLYATHGMSELLDEEGVNFFLLMLEYKIASSDYSPYLDISTCSLFVNKDYCLEYIERTGMKTVLFVEHNLSNLVDFNKYSNSFSAELKNYIEYTFGVSTLEEGYRLIIEFDNNQFSTIKVK